LVLVASLVPGTTLLAGPLLVTRVATLILSALLAALIALTTLTAVLVLLVSVFVCHKLKFNSLYAGKTCQ
jgi:type III secretory pathway component EscV